MWYITSSLSGARAAGARFIAQRRRQASAPAVNERGASEPPGRAPGGSAELLWLGAGGGGSKKKFTIYGVWRLGELTRGLVG